MGVLRSWPSLLRVPFKHVPLDSQLFQLELECICSPYMYMYQNRTTYVIYNTLHTDYSDAICLNLLVKLLYPRGLTKSSVFLQQFEVILPVFSLILISWKIFKCVLVHHMECQVIVLPFNMIWVGGGSIIQGYEEVVDAFRLNLKWIGVKWGRLLTVSGRRMNS